MRWGAVFGAGVALVCLAPQALAGEDSGPVGVSVTECPASAVDKDRLLDLVRTELAPRVVSEGDTAAEVVEISLCSGSSEVALVVLRAQGRNLAVRTVDLSDVAGDSRARTLAMAVAELITTGAPPPNVERAAPVMPPPDRAPPPETPLARPPVALSSSAMPGFGAALRAHFTPLTWLVGPWLGLSVGRVHGEALFLTTTNRPSLGKVTTSSAVGAAAVELLSLERQPSLGLRLRAELGVSWATGEPASTLVDEHPKTVLQAAGAAEGCSRLRLVGDLVGEVRLLAGLAHGLVASAGGEALASTDGPFVGLTLGIYYGPSSPP
jgi:hypothetical protein